MSNGEGDSSRRAFLPAIGRWMAFHLEFVVLVAFAAGSLAILVFYSGTKAMALVVAALVVSALITAMLSARYVRKSSNIEAQSFAESQRASRLLDEVEQNSQSWFWETDRQGYIRYLSPKVAAWLHADPAQLIGIHFARIAQGAPEGDLATPVGERTLGFYISTRTAFSELAVLAATEGEERWWSVSGRPVFDQQSRFRGFIGTGADLTEQRRSETAVARLARFDPLTGLANRTETSDMLNRAMLGTPGSVRPTGLMLIDLDRFKAVNDTLGHPAGDELLRQVAKRLSEVVGSQGQVGRLGGDEFKVVLPRVDNEVVLGEIAEAVIEAVSQPYLIHAAKVTIGASIGVAIAPKHGATTEELVRNCDLALYAAKGAGRGVHRFYDPSMLSVAEQRRLIEADMREALAQGEFRLVYQPIVALKNEKIIGFEALIRWQHPKRGPISPAQFIPVAEENGLIEAIGEWTLREAASAAASWSVDARISVNVSAIQFANPKFPALVANVLAQSGLHPDRLELEITESVFVEATEATDQQFALLKKLGVRLVLDDFGTGYSSLGYLQRAPFDKIKIDQSFVRGASLGQNQKNAAIIKAIVALAETVEMETTAEGVETQDEIAFIRELGCSHIQGFVFGKPLEAHDLIERLGTRGADAERVGHQSIREQRLRVFRLAHLSINGFPHDVRLRNVSAGGVMVESSHWVSIGTPVSIDITDDMTVAGTVCWCDEGRIGIAFDRRVDLKQVVPQNSQAGGVR